MHTSQVILLKCTGYENNAIIGACRLQDARHQLLCFAVLRSFCLLHVSLNYFSFSFIFVSSLSTASHCFSLKLIEYNVHFIGWFAQTQQTLWPTFVSLRSIFCRHLQVHVFLFLYLFTPMTSSRATSWQSDTTTALIGPQEMLPLDTHEADHRNH